jgi:hypothetical protein
MHRSIGDRLGEANCLYTWGLLDHATSEPAAARDKLRLAAEIYERIGNIPWANQAKELASSL